MNELKSIDQIKSDIACNRRYNWKSMIEYLIEQKSFDLIDKAVTEAMEQYASQSKEYKNVKVICINIKEKQNLDPTCLSSIPDGGLVKEYIDRYEWEVITHNGLNLMKVYKKDFVSVEIVL